MPLKNIKDRKEYMRLYRIRNRDFLCNQQRLKWKEYRLKVLSHYSNGDLKCSCCGEREYKFLSLDHIDGGGTQHRKNLKSKYIYSWIIQNNYPKGFQVLCYNCNMAKGFFGICPHQDKEQLLTNTFGKYEHEKSNSDNKE